MEDKQIADYLYLKSNIAWDVTPCSEVQVYRRFGDHTVSIFWGQTRNQQQAELCLLVAWLKS
jgi:hypothetical protein